MNRNILLLIGFLSFSIITAFGGNDILFRIDGDPVSVSEFEYIYNKNNFNNKADYSEQSLREYLDLYVNFRLKVKEAESLGLDKDPKLHSELKVYQEQLYNSFYDREKLGSLIDEAIERSNYDVGISHIFVNTPRGAGEQKIMEGKSKIMEAYEALEGGKSWDVIAKAYSEDKYTKDNGGFLGYYTVLQIAHYALENAAYQTEVGSYSEPIQTDLGFHIVKVNDKRKARGLVHIAVIKLNKKKSDIVYNNLVSEKIKDLYSSLSKGSDFAELAANNSEDPTTKEKGGEMEWFGISKYDPVFENAAFALENTGDISDPFETKNAWYIVKLLDKKNGGSADADKDLLTKKIKQSDRYTLQRKAHINGILDKYGYEVRQPEFNNYRKFAISRYETNVFKFEEVDSEQVIFSITGTDYTNKEFGEYLTKNTFKYRRMTNEAKFDQFFEDFKEEKAIEFHIYEYGNENKEYGALMNEYRDGILLFDLMEQKVWSKAVQDTAGLRTYFNANQENFKNPERARIKSYKVDGAKAENLLIKALTNDPDLTNMNWLSKLRKKDISTDHDDMVINKGDDLAKRINWKEGIYTVEIDDDIEIWQVTEIIPESNKSFGDSKGFAIAEYQEYLEDEWIDELKQKYKVEVDEDVLSGLVK